MSKIFSLVLILAVALTACAPAAAQPAGAAHPAGAAQPAGVQPSVAPLVIGAIPDQDPEVLQRQFGLVSDYLEAELGVPVEYKPVTDYAASVTAFRVGDLDLVWFGGLTGVQARLQAPDARALVQRDIDAEFHSVFIANAASGLQPITETGGLAALKGRTFTFGSDSSTSGRLMPQYFLEQAGVALTDFKGEAGFSGSHDATIELVETGTYEAGVLNEQVWKNRTAAGEVDLSKVVVLYTTPAYHDYHWVIRADVEQVYGAGFIDKVSAAFLKLDPADPQHKAILDLFGAQKFIPTENANYAEIEAIGRAIGKIR